MSQSIQLSFEMTRSVLKTIQLDSQIRTLGKHCAKLLSISANFSMQHSKVRCEVRKFVAKFKSSIRNSQASL